MPRKLRVVRRTACCLLTVLFWYLAAYVLMMDWRRPAYDPGTRTYADQSVYRFAPFYCIRSTVPRTAIQEVQCVCWANWVFRPIDSLVRCALASVDDRAKNLAMMHRTARPTVSMSPAEGSLK